MPGDHGRAHLCQAGQHGLDLTRLDPETPHLQLVICPAQELQTTIRQPPHPVTRPIQPAPASGERVGHEPLGRQRRAPQITAGHPATTDEQLARHPDRDRGESLIQHIHLRASDRRPDRRNTAPDGITHRPDRGLGRPVHVPHPGRPLHQRPRQGEWQRLTTTQRPQTRHTLPAVRHQHLPRRRRRLHHRHPGPHQLPRQRARHTCHLPIGDHHPGARHQRQPQLKPRDVEARRRHRQQHIPGAQPRTLSHRRQETRQVAVRDLHTLRPTRRPRRIQHIRQLVTRNGDFRS